MSALEDDEDAPMTPAAIAAWWDRCGLDNRAAAQQLRADYAVQKAAADAVMRAIVPVVSLDGTGHKIPKVGQRS